MKTHSHVTDGRSHRHTHTQTHTHRHTHTQTHTGNPLQNSHLEAPMDKERLAGHSP